MNKRKVILWSLTVAMGGFLFGFDTAVISGAEKSIQQYWQLNSFQHGLTISIALIGTIIGAMFGSIPSDAIGRKQTLFFVAIFYLVASSGTALSQNWYLFLFFRFLGGLGVGASSVTAPIYISEISPADSRGRLVALFQFNVVFGILISYFSNYLIGASTETSWRWMLGVQAFPSIAFLILIRLVPETPRWLILHKGDFETAKKTLQIINPTTYEKDFDSIMAGHEHDAEKHVKEPLFQKKYNFPIILAVLFAIFNQVSGINAIIYYAPRIFEMTGLGESSSLLSTAGIGLVNFIFTLLAIRFIDKVGRRNLMFIGSIGLILSLSLVSWAFFTEDFGGYTIIISLIIFMAFFAFSQGAVIWVFISEIFPNQVRAKGQTLGSVTHWIMAAGIAFIFPTLTEKLGGGTTFLFFALMMVLQLLFVWKMMPETKGQSLEQIETAMLLH
ncbi:sugar porter family MFS transporter [Limnovirga soli]|uniref:Sugar porter family MFS transporter n=1 Tax=Limnovirga soli TaxID=2656915 RepID=A0A8J8FB96_9BACT|nr:sugar porter family MFS transporter [Limnovirga soli]NNV54855.1 sugar porter family MFS transporter [Limnovirga soli]